MSIPPWYRPRRRPLAEAVLSINLSRASGIGPLVPGLSVTWDMTPLLCLSDPDYKVRLTVDVDGQALNVKHRRLYIASVRLVPDPKRIGAPLRAVCDCGRRCYRLYLWGSYLRCGKCLRVGYASGRGGESDRAHARMARLESRLSCTEWQPRHRGRRRINAEIARQDERLFLAMPGRLLKYLAQAVGS